MSDQALEALSASLGTRIPEPELDLSSIKEVAEVLILDLMSAGSRTGCLLHV